MKLSIIIPFFKQLELLKRLLKSIKKQDLNKEEYEVIIVDDKSPIPLTQEDLKDFEFNLKIITLNDNLGPGFARQRGLADATGEFALFCDADDYLMDKITLTKLLNEIEDNDVLVSAFIEDTEKKGKNGETISIPHFNDATWMHGKLYRIKYLRDEKIYFHPILRQNEDGYFNNIALNCTKKVKYINYISYCWSNTNDESITRNNDKEYNFKGFFEFIMSSRLSLSNLYKRQNPKIITMVCHTLAYCYYTFQNKGWKDKKNKNDYDQAINEFKVFYNMFENVLEVLDDNVVIFWESLTRAREIAYKSGAFIESETFKQFIQKLGLKVYKCFR